MCNKEERQDHIQYVVEQVIVQWYQHICVVEQGIMANRMSLLKENCKCTSSVFRFQNCLCNTKTCQLEICIMVSVLHLYRISLFRTPVFLGIPVVDFRSCLCFGIKDYNKDVQYTSFIE